MNNTSKTNDQDPAMKMIENCIFYGVSSNESVKNIFVNGDVSNCQIKAKNMVVIGDVTTSKISSAATVIPISNEENYIDNMLFREAQRGWKIVDNILSEKKTSEYISVRTSCIVARTFSKSIQMMNGLSEDEVINVCSEILRYINSVKKRSN